MNYTDNPACWAILLAAGSGSRMSGAAVLPKQFLPWHGAPLYWASALALCACPKIEGIVFVFPKEACEDERIRLAELIRMEQPGIIWSVAAGGVTRRDSAYNGLLHVPSNCRKVLVHDAARPFLRPWLVNRACDMLDDENTGCIVPAVPVTDTIKIAGPGNAPLVEATLPREKLWAVQTPQGFKTDLLRRAHAEAREKNIAATDDASLLEAVGIPVRLCMGDPGNVKITRPEDLELLAEKDNAPPRAGFGYDVHRYGQGRPLKLGGVAIPGGFEVIAHSDGDVLLHALMDAICGCAGIGDIGRLFPDTDPALDGISSAILLDQTLALAKNAGIKITNADITIVAQKPKIAPHSQEIRRNVARLLALPEDCVNIKATTEEGLGFTGNLEGIKACAIVCAQKTTHPSHNF